MSLPALHEIRMAFPKTSITLLLNEAVEPLLEGHPDADQFLYWGVKEGQGWWNILRWTGKLRKERFDAAIIFNPSRLFHVATFLAGIPLRIGYRRKMGILLNRSIRDTKASRTSHEIDYNLELARLLGLSPSTPVLCLPKRPDAEAEAGRILESVGHSSSCRPIAIHPWTSNFARTEHRRWPLESFQNLAITLKDCGQPILIIGSPEFSSLMDTWELKGICGVTNLVGQIPLKVLPALLRRSSVLISNDSGPVHIAVAVGTPTIVVASKSQAPVLNRWGPRGPEHLVLLAPSVEEVATTVQARLARSEPGRIERCES